MADPGRRSPESSRRRRRQEREAYDQYYASNPTPQPSAAAASYYQDAAGSKMNDDGNNRNATYDKPVYNDPTTTTTTTSRSYPQQQQQQYQPYPQQQQQQHQQSPYNNNNSHNHMSYRSRAGSSSSSGSSTSSAYLDISRRYPDSKAGVLATFFKTPSERRRLRRKLSGTKKKAKRSRVLYFGNSSSSSVDSDMAYGTGYIPRKKSRDFSQRHGSDRNGHGYQAHAGPSSQAYAGSYAPSQQQHGYPQQPGPHTPSQVPSYMPPQAPSHIPSAAPSALGVVAGAAAAGAAVGLAADYYNTRDNPTPAMPRTPVRNNTDEEILKIGRQLSDLAKLQNDEDLRLQGRTRPSGLMSAASQINEFRKNKKNSGPPGARGLGSSKPYRGSSDDESDWESASDDDDDYSDDSADSSMAYGTVVSAAIRPTAAAAAGAAVGAAVASSALRGGSQKSSTVDPSLFGPYNSLRDIVNTPCGFGEDGRPLSRRADAPPRLPHTTSEPLAPLREVDPIPMSDAGRVDAYSTKRNTFPDPREASQRRPEPVPLQQPKPVTPVGPNVYNAKIYDDLKREDPQRKEARSGGSSDWVVPAAAAAAIAGGAIALSKSDDKDKDSSRRSDKRPDRERSERRERREKEKEEDKYSKRDSDRSDRKRRSKESSSKADRKEEKDSKRASRSEDREDRTRRDAAPEKPSSRITYRDLADRDLRDQIHVEYEPEDRRSEISRSSKKDGKKPEKRDDRHRDRPEPSAVPKALEKQSDDKKVDPFKFQVNDWMVPNSSAPARPLTPNMVTVDREPHFSSSDDERPPVRDRLSRRDSFEIERRAEEDKRHADHEQAKSVAAPVVVGAAAGIAAAAVAASSKSKDRRSRGRDEYSDDGSRERTRDPVQEEADRYYRESENRRHAAEEQIRSRDTSPDRSVMDKYEPEQKEPVRVVTPPEYHKPEKGRYDAPNADVMIDNKIFPRDSHIYRAGVIGRDTPVFMSKDPDCERERPLLNLVYPTPVSSRQPTPAPEPEKEPAKEPAKEETRTRERSRSRDRSRTRSEREPEPEPTSRKVRDREDDGAKSEVGYSRRRSEPREDVTARSDVGTYSYGTGEPSPSAKSVKWGENSTSTYEVVTPEPRDDAELGHEDKPRPRLSKGSKWGAMSAAIASNSIEPANEPEPATWDVPASSRQNPSGAWDADAPPVPGPKPASPQPEQMPGSFADDIEFAGTLAAGLKDSGFDPNIVIDDPTFRRRDSPPGSNGTNGNGWHSEPSGDHDTSARSFSASDGGYVDVSKDDALPSETSDRKLSKKERKKKRQSIDAAEVPLPEATEPKAVEEPSEPESKLSKKERRRREKATAEAAAQESERQIYAEPEAIQESFQDASGRWDTPSSRKSSKTRDLDDGERVTVPVDAFSYLVEDRKPEEDSRKSKKKSSRSSTYDSPSRSAPGSEVDWAGDMQSSREIHADDERDSARKTRRRSKRDSYGYESPSRSVVGSEVSVDSAGKRKSKRRSGTEDDFRDYGDDPPDRHRDRFEDRDVSSVVSEPRYDEKRRGSRSKRDYRYDDDDTKSVASAPGSGRKSKDLEKRSSGSLFSSIFKSSSKDKDDKKDSFLDNAGTFGTGVGLVAGAAALSRLNATEAFADKKQKSQEEISEWSRGVKDAEEVAEPVKSRVIKPAIDPQYGDLLPLPPSEPSSPVKADTAEAEEEQLPALPDSRPDTPPEEAFERSHARRRSAHDVPKTPSNTAIPLQLRLGQRSGPGSPGFRSSPVASPSRPEAVSTPTSARRPTSWDSSREIRPLYLIERSGQGHMEASTRDAELAALPPSDASSRAESEAWESADEYVSYSPEGGSALDKALRIDTGIAAAHVPEDGGSQETTPKATTFRQDQLDFTPQTPDPDPVEAMSKDRSSYLLQSAPSSTKSNRSVDNDTLEQRLNDISLTPTKQGHRRIGSEDLTSADEHFSDALEGPGSDSPLFNRGPVEPEPVVAAPLEEDTSAAEQTAASTADEGAGEDLSHLSAKERKKLKKKAKKNASKATPAVEEPQVVEPSAEPPAETQVEAVPTTEEPAADRSLDGTAAPTEEVAPEIVPETVPESAADSTVEPIAERALVSDAPADDTSPAPADPEPEESETPTKGKKKNKKKKKNALALVLDPSEAPSAEPDAAADEGTKEVAEEPAKVDEATEVVAEPAEPTTEPASETTAEQILEPPAEPAVETAPSDEPITEDVSKELALDGEKDVQPEPTVDATETAKEETEAEEPSGKKGKNKKKKKKAKDNLLAEAEPEPVPADDKAEPEAVADVPTDAPAEPFSTADVEVTDAPKELEPEAEAQPAAEPEPAVESQAEPTEPESAPVVDEQPVDTAIEDSWGGPTLSKKQKKKNKKKGLLLDEQTPEDSSTEPATPANETETVAQLTEVEAPATAEAEEAPKDDTVVEDVAKAEPEQEQKAEPGPEVEPEIPETPAAEEVATPLEEESGLTLTGKKKKKKNKKDKKNAALAEAAEDDATPAEKPAEESQPVSEEPAAPSAEDAVTDLPKDEPSADVVEHTVQPDEVVVESKPDAEPSTLQSHPSEPLFTQDESFAATTQEPSSVEPTQEPEIVEPEPEQDAAPISKKQAKKNKKKQQQHQQDFGWGYEEPSQEPETQPEVAGPATADIGDVDQALDDWDVSARDVKPETAQEVKKSGWDLDDDFFMSTAPSKKDKAVEKSPAAEVTDVSKDAEAPETTEAAPTAEPVVAEEVAAEPEAPVETPAETPADAGDDDLGAATGGKKSKKAKKKEKAKLAKLEAEAEAAKEAEAAAAAEPEAEPSPEQPAETSAEVTEPKPEDEPAAAEEPATTEEAPKDAPEPPAVEEPVVEEKVDQPEEQKDEESAPEEPAQPAGKKKKKKKKGQNADNTTEEVASAEAVPEPEATTDEPQKQDGEAETEFKDAEPTTTTDTPTDSTIPDDATPLDKTEGDAAAKTDAVEPEVVNIEPAADQPAEPKAEDTPEPVEAVSTVKLSKSQKKKLKKQAEKQAALDKANADKTATDDNKPDTGSGSADADDQSPANTSGFATPAEEPEAAADDERGGFSLQPSDQDEKKMKAKETEIELAQDPEKTAPSESAPDNINADELETASDTPRGEDGPDDSLAAPSGTGTGTGLETGETGTGTGTGELDLVAADATPAAAAPPALGDDAAQDEPAQPSYDNNDDDLARGEEEKKKKHRTELAAEEPVEEPVEPDGGASPGDPEPQTQQQPSDPENDSWDTGVSAKDKKKKRKSKSVTFDLGEAAPVAPGDDDDGGDIKPADEAETADAQPDLQPAEAASRDIPGDEALPLTEEPSSIQEPDVAWEPVQTADDVAPAPKEAGPVVTDEASASEDILQPSQEPSEQPAEDVELEDLAKVSEETGRESKTEEVSLPEPIAQDDANSKADESQPLEAAEPTLPAEAETEPLVKLSKKERKRREKAAALAAALAAQEGSDEPAATPTEPAEETDVSPPQDVKPEGETEIAPVAGDEQRDLAEAEGAFLTQDNAQEAIQKDAGQPVEQPQDDVAATDVITTSEVAEVALPSSDDIIDGDKPAAVEAGEADSARDIPSTSEKDAAADLKVDEPTEQATDVAAAELTDDAKPAEPTTVEEPEAPVTTEPEVAKPLQEVQQQPEPESASAEKEVPASEQPPVETSPPAEEIDPMAALELDPAWKSLSNKEKKKRKKAAREKAAELEAAKEAAQQAAQELAEKSAAETSVEATAETVAAPEPTAEVEPTTEAEPTDKAEPTPEAEPIVGAEPAAEPVVELATEAAEEPVDKAGPAIEPAVEPESEPVIEAERAVEPSAEPVVEPAVDEPVVEAEHADLTKTETQLETVEQLEKQPEEPEKPVVTEAAEQETTETSAPTDIPPETQKEATEPEFDEDLFKGLSKTQKKKLRQKLKAEAEAKAKAEAEAREKEAAVVEEPAPQPEEAPVPEPVEEAPKALETEADAQEKEAVVEEPPSQPEAEPVTEVAVEPKEPVETQIEAGEKEAPVEELTPQPKEATISEVLEEPSEPLEPQTEPSVRVEADAGLLETQDLKADEPALSQDVEEAQPTITETVPPAEAEAEVDSDAGLSKTARKKKKQKAKAAAEAAAREAALEQERQAEAAAESVKEPVEEFATAEKADTEADDKPPSESLDVPQAEGDEKPAEAGEALATVDEQPKEEGAPQDDLKKDDASQEESIPEPSKADMPQEDLAQEAIPEELVKPSEEVIAAEPELAEEPPKDGDVVKPLEELQPDESSASKSEDPSSELTVEETASVEETPVAQLSKSQKKKLKQQQAKEAAAAAAAAKEAEEQVQTPEPSSELQEEARSLDEPAPKIEAQPLPTIEEETPMPSDAPLPTESLLPSETATPSEPAPVPDVDQENDDDPSMAGLSKKQKKKLKQQRQKEKEKALALSSPAEPVETADETTHDEDKPVEPEAKTELEPEPQPDVQTTKEQDTADQPEPEVVESVEPPIATEADIVPPAEVSQPATLEDKQPEEPAEAVEPEPAKQEPEMEQTETVLAEDVTDVKKEIPTEEKAPAAETVVAAADPVEAALERKLSNKEKKRLKKLGLLGKQPEAVPETEQAPTPVSEAEPALEEKAAPTEEQPADDTPTEAEQPEQAATPSEELPTTATADPVPIESAQEHQVEPVQKEQAPALTKKMSKKEKRKAEKLAAEAVASAAAAVATETSEAVNDGPNSPKDTDVSLPQAEDISPAEAVQEPEPEAVTEVAVEDTPVPDAEVTPIQVQGEPDDKPDEKSEDVSAPVAEEEVVEVSTDKPALLDTANEDNDKQMMELGTPAEPHVQPQPESQDTPMVEAEQPEASASREIETPTAEPSPTETEQAAEIDAWALPSKKKGKKDKKGKKSIAENQTPPVETEPEPVLEPESISVPAPATEPETVVEAKDEPTIQEEAAEQEAAPTEEPSAAVEEPISQESAEAAADEEELAALDAKKARKKSKLTKKEKQRYQALEEKISARKRKLEVAAAAAEPVAEPEPEQAKEPELPAEAAVDPVTELASEPTDDVKPEPEAEPASTIEASSEAPKDTERDFTQGLEDAAVGKDIEMMPAPQPVLDDRTATEADKPAESVEDTWGLPSKKSKKVNKLNASRFAMFEQSQAGEASVQDDQSTSRELAQSSETPSEQLAVATEPKSEPEIETQPAEVSEVVDQGKALESEPEQRHEPEPEVLPVHEEAAPAPEDAILAKSPDVEMEDVAAAQPTVEEVPILVTAPVLDDAQPQTESRELEPTTLEPEVPVPETQPQEQEQAQEKAEVAEETPVLPAAEEASPDDVWAFTDKKSKKKGKKGKSKQSTPVVEEPAPVSKEPEPVVEEPGPIVEEVKAATEEPTPVVAAAEPIVEEPEPTPAVEEVKAITEEPVPVVEEVAPIVEEPAPVTKEAEPATEEPASTIEEPAAKDIQEAVPPAQDIPEPISMDVDTPRQVLEDDWTEPSSTSKPKKNKKKKGKAKALDEFMVDAAPEPTAELSRELVPEDTEVQTPLQEASEADKSTPPAPEQTEPDQATLVPPVTAMDVDVPAASSAELRPSEEPAVAHEPISAPASNDRDMEMTEAQPELPKEEVSQHEVLEAASRQLPEETVVTQPEESGSKKLGTVAAVAGTAAALLGSTSEGKDKKDKKKSKKDKKQKDADKRELQGEDSFDEPATRDIADKKDLREEAPASEPDVVARDVPVVEEENMKKVALAAPESEGFWGSREDRGERTEVSDRGLGEAALQEKVLPPGSDDKMDVVERAIFEPHKKDAFLAGEQAPISAAEPVPVFTTTTTSDDRGRANDRGPAIVEPAKERGLDVAAERAMPDETAHNSNLAWLTPKTESLSGSEGGWRDGSRGGVRLDEEMDESPVLGRGEASVRPVELLQRGPEVQEPVGGLLREDSQASALGGSYSYGYGPEFGYGEGSRTSPSRSLPAVQEIPEAEVEVKSKRQSKTKDRDSGFSTDSPHPLSRRSHLFDETEPRQQRDSGVHTDEWEASTPAKSRSIRTPHGTPVLEPPASKATPEPEKKSKPKSKVAETPSKRSAPTTVSTPVVTPTRSAPDTTPVESPLRPSRSRPSLRPVASRRRLGESTPESPLRSRKSREYGDLGASPMAAAAGAAGLGAAAAAAAATSSSSASAGAPGQRSVSDNTQSPHRAQRDSPPSDRLPRRSVSNTSLMRKNTPEPLSLSHSHKMRPDSPGSNVSNVSIKPSPTPPLRRVDKRMSGDLRAIRQQNNNNKDSKDETPVANEGRVRSKDMTDVYDGFGEGRIGSPRSPTRPHSMRRRQSMQVLELENKVEQLLAENRMLTEARSHVEQNASSRTAAVLSERDAEIEALKQSLQFLQNEVSRLTEVNQGLTTANAELANKDSARFADLEVRHTQATRDLDQVRGEHNAFQQSLQDKDAEIADLRAQLEAAKEQVREVQRQILESKAADADFLNLQDEDYFDHRCQQLCSHVQQWVLRFSKFSDMRACRLTSEINDEKTIDRLDNAVLDGSDVDRYLSDRVKRRDIFMSMTMNMIWEFVFTRYLFGMDREQRQKLKSLEKMLTEVGPPQAVRQWRAVTLTLLAKRENFRDQRDQDTEAVVQAIFSTLCRILPPPSNLEGQIQSQLRRVLREAVDLSIEMRTQKAEYMMLPPLQPEYDSEGELTATVQFNASMMNERSGKGLPNDDLEAEGAIVRIVLFPLVVKKGDDSGVGDDEIVVCPAQVIVASTGLKRNFAPSSDAGGASLGARSHISVVTEHMTGA